MYAIYPKKIKKETILIWLWALFSPGHRLELWSSENDRPLRYLRHSINGMDPPVPLILRTVRDYNAGVLNNYQILKNKI